MYYYKTLNSHRINNKNQKFRRCKYAIISVRLNKLETENKYRKKLEIIR